jgi:GTP cyclohydrolase II
VTSPVVPATVRRQVRLPLAMEGDSEADVFTFDGLCDGGEHLALALGDHARSPYDAARPGSVPLVRLHSECLTGDVLGSGRCDCGPQLQEALVRIAAAGGYLLYLRQEGRDIGLYNKIDAYALQEAGLDTYEANVALGFDEDQRDYRVAAQMLLGLGIGRLRLLSNNPDKAAQLEAAGIRVDGVVPTQLHLSGANGRYLAAKASRGHHPLNLAPEGTRHSYTNSCGPG